MCCACFVHVWRAHAPFPTALAVEVDATGTVRGWRKDATMLRDIRERAGISKKVFDDRMAKWS